MTGCLVAFAARLNVPAMDHALERLRQCVQRHMPHNAFAARVHAELVRMGVAKN
jgi:hypothetical protein